MTLKNTLFVSVLFINSFVFCQTGAAGVGNSATLPMWFDANELNLSDGSQVFQFDDISGNGNHLTQTNSSRRPVFTQIGLNGLPVVTFDGVNDFLTRGATAGLEGTNFSYFIVFQRTVGLNQSLIDVGYSASTSKWTTYSLGSNNRLVSLHRSPSNKVVFHVDNGSPTFVSTHITSTNFRQYRQGILQQNLNTSYTAAVGHNLIRVGAYNFNLTSYFLNGFIAEIIIYNSSLNNLERVLVENYLGAKYNMSVPTDLYAYQGSHNIGLIGIGDNGPNIQTTATGHGILTLSGATNLGDDEYLLVAHTNDDLTEFTTTGLPISLSGHQYFTRTWRAGETGDVGNVTLTFDLSGGNDFADPTTYNLLLDSDDDFSDAAIVPGTYNALNQTVSFTVNLNDGDFFTISGLFQSLVINSITDGNWSQPGTWDCGCVPSQNDEVFIQPTHEVEVDIDAKCLNLEIVSGGTLTMSTGNELGIRGNFNAYGSFVAGSGTVLFEGFSDQEFDDLGNGTEFNNITVDNSGGDVIFYASDIILSGTLNLIQGNFDVSDPGMNFIVNSTSATQGGRIAPIIGSSQVIGEIGVRRFIPGGNADWRDICSPVIGSTFADWDPDLAMSGPSFPDGCASGFGDPCWRSVRYTLNGTQVDVLNVNDPILNNRGYYLFMGEDLTTFSGTVLTSYGTAHGSSDVVRNMTTGWQTVGNPFVSPILFSELTITSNVGNYFYVYDNTIGDYQWYDGASNTSSIPQLADGMLATGQGFWILMSGAGSMTFHQTSKTQTATYIRSEELTTADKNLTLVLKQEGTTYQTSIMLEASSFATDGADTLADMMYLETGLEAAPRLYMNYPEHKVRKNFIQNDSRNKSFELYTKIKNEGYYSFSIENMNDNFSDYRAILLYDNETGEFVNLKNETSYTFYSDVYEGSRFTLVLTNLEVVPEATVESLSINENELTGSNLITITQMGHLFDIVASSDLNQNSEISLVNVLGQTTVFTEWAQIVQGSNIVAVPEDIKGVHVLVIRTGDEVITKKVVL